MDRQLSQHQQQGGDDRLPPPAAAPSPQAAIPAASLRLLQSLATSAAAAPQQQAHYHQQRQPPLTWQQQAQQQRAQHNTHASTTQSNVHGQAQYNTTQAPQHGMGYLGPQQPVSSAGRQYPGAGRQYQSQAPAIAQGVEDSGGNRPRPAPRQLYQPPRRTDQGLPQQSWAGNAAGLAVQAGQQRPGFLRPAPAGNSLERPLTSPAQGPAGTANTNGSGQQGDQRFGGQGDHRFGQPGEHRDGRWQGGRQQRPGYPSVRHVASRTGHTEAMQAWPGSDWISHISLGVRVKGTRLANMLDGIIPGDVPHMFRVHSTSGQAEYWPLDMLSCLCGCPNDSDCCSHKYAIAVSRPQYRPKLALLIKARELFDGAVAGREPLDPCIAELARGFSTYLQRSNITELPAVCQVTSETVIALLLQQYIDDPANRNRMWWRSSSTTATPASKASVTVQQVVSTLLKCASKFRKKTLGRAGRLVVRLEALKVQLREQGKPVPPDPTWLTELVPPQKRTAGALQDNTGSSSASAGNAGDSHDNESFDGEGSDDEAESKKSGGLSMSAAAARSARLHKPKPASVVLFDLVQQACLQLGLDRLTQLTADDSMQVAAANHAQPRSDRASSPFLRAPGKGYAAVSSSNSSTTVTEGQTGKGTAESEAFHQAALSDGLLTLMAGSEELQQALDTLLRNCVMMQLLSEHVGFMIGSLDAPAGLLQASEGGQSESALAAGPQQVDAADKATPASTAVKADNDALQMLYEAAAEHVRQQLSSAKVVEAAPDGAVQTAAQQVLDQLIKLDVAVQSSHQQQLLQHSNSSSRSGNRQESLGLLQLVGTPAADRSVGPGADSTERAAQLQQLLVQSICHVLMRAGLAKQTEEREEEQEGKAEEERQAAQCGVPGITKADVVTFCSQALQACAATPAITKDSMPASQLQLIEEAACRQFQVQLFSQLACGELSSLLSLQHSSGSALQLTKSRGLEHDVAYAEALLAGAARAESPYTNGVHGSTVQFSPLLGAFNHSSGFHGGHAPTHIALPGAGHTSIAIDITLASVEGVGEAVRACDGQLAVHSVLALCAMHGGAAHMPWQLLSSTVANALVSVLGGSTGITRSRIAQYALDVALCMPHPFSACTQIVSLLLPSQLLARNLTTPANDSALEEHTAGAPTEQVISSPSMQPNAQQVLDSSVAAAVLDLVVRIHSAPLRQVASQKLAELGHTLNVPIWTEAPQRVAKRQPQTADSLYQEGDAQLPQPAATTDVQQHNSGTADQLPGPSTATDTVLSATEKGVFSQSPAAEQPTRHLSAATVQPPQGRLDGHDDRTSDVSATAMQAEQYGTGGDTIQSKHVPASTARAVIEDIRQKEFGIGMTSSPEVKAVLAAQHARLRRALDRLSADLYSQKVHLLLELVQNVDDSTFELPAESQVVPTMGLWVGPTGLAATSNESGFTERDVRALCDVGNSAKVARKAAEAGGQTGEKGIGFKSVFAVSDRPHVSSNGFTFGFNAQDPSGIGMMLPHWLGDGSQAQESEDQCDVWHYPPGSWPCPPALLEGAAWTTHIWLPAADRLLKVSDSLSSTSSWHAVATELVAGVVPSLLLFLRRVQRIVLADALSGVVHVLSRKVKDATIEVTHCVCAASAPAHPDPRQNGLSADFTLGPLQSSHTYQWLLGTHRLRTPTISRRDVTLPYTDITIAVPIPSPTNTAAPGKAADSTTIGGSEQTATGQTAHSANGDGSTDASVVSADVYAFLPVRSYGLPFALQADWLVPSSREDVLSGEAWNQLLREQAPVAFTRAVQLAGSHSGLRYQWLSYLPQAASAQGFIRPLASTIPAALRSLPCIPTLGGKMVPPQAVLIADSDVMALLAEARVLQVLQLHFAHPQLLASCVDNSASQSVASYGASGVSRHEQALLQLGAQRFAATHLMKLFQAIGMEALVSEPPTLCEINTNSNSNMQLSAGSKGAETWAKRCERAWQLLALLERLLAAETGAGGFHHAFNFNTQRSRNHGVGGASNSGARHLLQQLAGVAMVPVVGGRWAAPSPSLLLTPHFNDELQQLEQAESDSDGEEVQQPQPDETRIPGLRSQLDNDQSARAAPTDGSNGYAGTSCASQDNVSWEGLEELRSLSGGPTALPVVDVTVLLGSTLPSHIRQAAAHCLTSRLHVRPATPTDIINHHVLPALQARKQTVDWQGEEGAVVAYAAFLMKHQHLAASNPSVAATWLAALPLLLVSPQSHAAQRSIQTSKAISPGTAIATEPSHAYQGVMEIVPASTGAILGLSFCESTGAASRNTTTAALTSAEALPMYSATSHSPVTGSTAGQADQVDMHMQPTSRTVKLSYPLHRVMQQALHDVPCCLHPAYLQHGSAQEWVQFFGHVLRCGFTFVRPQPPTYTTLGKPGLEAAAQPAAHLTQGGHAVAAVQAVHTVQGVQGSQAVQAGQGAQTVQARHEALAVESLHSTDLARILAWFQQDSAKHSAAGLDMDLVQQAMVELWQVLDSCWQKELASYCKLLDLEPYRSSVLGLPSGTGQFSQQQTQDQQFGQLLTQCRCLPIGSPASHGDLGQISQDAPRSWRPASPADGPWPARSARNLMLLGPNASYVIPTLHSPELLRLLRVQQEPSVPSLLHQLYLWQQQASSLITTGTQPLSTVLDVEVNEQRLAIEDEGGDDSEGHASAQQVVEDDSTTSTAENGVGNAVAASATEALLQPDVSTLVSIYTFLWQQYVQAGEHQQAASCKGDAGFGCSTPLQHSFQELLATCFVAQGSPPFTLQWALRTAFQQFPLLAVLQAQHTHSPPKSEATHSQTHLAAGATRQTCTSSSLSWIKVGVGNIEAAAAAAGGPQRPCLTAGQACWKDSSGVICGTVLPTPLSHVYPTSLQYFFTHILGVCGEPCEHDLLRCLEHAHDADDASTAWACLTHVATLLHGRVNLPSQAPADGELSTTEQHRGNTSAGQLVLGSNPSAEQPHSNSQEQQQSQKTGVQEAHTPASCTLDWQHILSIQALLPAAQLTSVAADSAADSTEQQRQHQVHNWVSAADPHVYLQQTPEQHVWQGSRREHTPPVAVTADVLKQLQGAAHACGLTLHCITPPDPSSLSNIPSRQQASKLQRGMPNGQAATCDTEHRQHADLYWLLTEVLHLKSLQHFIQRQALSSQGVVIKPAALLSQLLPRKQQPSQQPVSQAAAAQAVGGALLRLDVAAQLQRAIPLVVQYLTAKRLHLVQNCLLPSGVNGVDEPGEQQQTNKQQQQHSQDEQQQKKRSSWRDLGHALQHLLVVSIPGLQSRHVMPSEGIATQAQTCHAVLLWHHLGTPQGSNTDRHGPAPTAASTADIAMPVLFIQTPEDHQHANLQLGSMTHPSDLPAISFVTWRHLLREFSSLFNDPIGVPDDELTSLLLMQHSLAGQPEQEVAQALQAIHPLPDLCTHPEGATLLAAAQQCWTVGSIWQQPPQHTPDLTGTAARQMSERSELAEDEVVWQSRGTGASTPTPLKLTQEGSSTADAVREQPHTSYTTHTSEREHHETGPLAHEASTAQGSLDQGPNLADAVDAGTQQGMGDHDDRRGQGQAHGFETQRPLAGQPQYTGPMGSFVSEAVEVEPAVRAQLPHFAVAPDADADQRARRAVVGRLGEQLVYQTLQHRAATGVEVQWVNEHDEAGLPYDVLITRADGSKEYVEVKATSSTDKVYLEVSHREWLFAQQEGDRYHLYRVSGVGSEHPEIKRIVNPYMQWRSQRIGICLAL